MQLDGRRQSTNVDDRRGRSVGKAGGIGLGGLLLAGILYLVLGVDPTPVLQQAGGLTGGTQTEYTPTAEEVGLEPSALTGEIVRFKTDATTQIAIVKPQLMRHGFVYLLRVVQILLELCHIVRCRYFYATQHGRHFSVNPLHDVLGTLFALNHRNGYINKGHPSNDQHIEDYHYQDDAPSNAA